VASRLGYLRVVIVLSGSLVFNGTGHAQSTEVSATGSVSSPSITSKETLRFTVTIKNKTNATLSSVRVVSVPDDYQLEQMCVLTEAAGTECYGSLALLSSHNVFAPSILPGRSFTTWGYLKPKATHRVESLTLIVGWTPSAATTDLSSPSSLAVSLGQNEVQSCFGPYKPLLSEILKGLAIPLALAIFGTVLTVILKRRDEQNAKLEKERDEQNARLEKEREVMRQDAEKERDQIRQKAEKERDEIRQERQRDQALKAETWNKMLPVSHEYASKYYLPVCNAAERLATFLGKKNDEVAFFYLLFLWKRMIETINGVGGFYFKSLLGEALAVECWHRQKEFLLGPDDAPLNLKVKGSMALLGPTETFQAFTAKLENLNSDPTFQNSDVQQGLKLFREWTKNDANVSDLILVLKAFCAVLDYEANRPYEYWYDPPARMKVSEEVENLLRSIAVAEKFSMEEIEAYFKGRIRDEPTTRE
jgi:hypothetical protein